MFAYYGNKKRLASLYPKPKYSLIIEPFCGAAGYACLYPEHDVKLYDIYPAIVKAWEYLISATRDDIMSLPLVEEGQRLDRFGLSEGERCLLGFMISASPATSKTTVTQMSRWTLNNRSLIARFVQKIGHWQIECRSFQDIPNYKGTWFVDPPYQVQGHHYKHSKVDYQMLSSRVRNDWKGQRIVCESMEANWAPFTRLVSAIGQKNSKLTECLWLLED